LEAYLFLAQLKKDCVNEKINFENAFATGPIGAASKAGDRERRNGSEAKKVGDLVT
jgi:hypothetical protein